MNTYVNGSISSSFQLGFGPSATVVLEKFPWKTASTNGRTCDCGEQREREKNEMMSELPARKGVGEFSFCAFYRRKLSDGNIQISQFTVLLQ